MNSRRNFLKTTGKAIAMISVAPGVVANSAFTFPPEKHIRIGIIGAENSHTAGYGRLFNIDKKFPGVEVLYVWGETDEFARAAMEKGKIPNQVKDPNEMLGKIDAEIQKFVFEGYETAANILKKYKKQLDTVTKALVEKETLEGDEFEELMKNS